MTEEECDLPAWIPVSLGDVPLVVCGPILRRVEKDVTTGTNSVSVWMVLKEKRKVTLKIYGPDYGEGSTAPLFQSSETTPIKLGANIYVTCVTAETDVFNFNDTDTYGYNVEFYDEEEDSIVDFDSPGVLKIGSSGIDYITYEDTPIFGKDYIGESLLGMKLPTFVLPKSNLRNLRILHGSCRKPHGEGYDAFPIINEIIKNTITPSAYERPQMLCLTGDQIYADDVSDSLLYMIRYYSEMLFGWEETHSYIAAEDISDPYDYLKPGNRFYYIEDEYKMNTPGAEEKKAKSHLIWFKEFMTMYLMVWSPNLWGAGGVPYILELLSGKDVDANDVIDLCTETSRLLLFKKTLPEVRTLMANIPSYMTIDDHEVTDDLFIKANWSSQMLNGSLSKRVLQNGFSAFAICQAWGNTPNQFKADESGGELLSYFERIAENNNVHSPENDINSLWNYDIAQIVLPFLSPEVDGVYEMLHTSNGLDYHWHYQGVHFEVIGLDCRTMRVYRKGFDEPCGNLSKKAIEKQINNLPGPFKVVTFVVTSIPTIGVEWIEAQIWFAGVTFASHEKRDYESMNIDQYSRFALMSGIASRAKFFPPTSSKRKHRAVILSGDVHYAFTSKLRYDANTTFLFNYSNTELKITQCCASSFKNETTPSKGPGGYFDASTKWQHDLVLENEKWDFIDVVGYNHRDGPIDLKLEKRSGGDLIKTNSVTVYGEPFIQEVVKTTSVYYEDVTYNFNPEPDWQFKMEPIKSKFIKGTHVSLPVESFKNYLKVSGFHKYNYNYNLAEYIHNNKVFTKYGRYVVGVNNFGDVEFDDWDNRKMTHKLWWRNLAKSPEDDPLPGFPLTIHELDLSFDD